MGLPCHDGEVEGVVVEDDAVLVLKSESLTSKHIDRSSIKSPEGLICIEII